MAQIWQMSYHKEGDESEGVRDPAALAIQRKNFFLLGH